MPSVLKQKQSSDYNIGWGEFGGCLLRLIAYGAPTNEICVEICYLYRDDFVILIFGCDFSKVPEVCAVSSLH